MKIIYTNKGEEIFVDDADYEWLNQWKWHVNAQGYVVRREHIRISYKKYRGNWVRMHRQIMGLNKFDKREVDHKYGHKQDNRRSQLRVSTRKENSVNIGKQINNTSGERNVTWDRVNNKWRVQFMVDGKGVSFGRYINFEEAVKVARKKRAELFGEFGTTR